MKLLNLFALSDAVKPELFFKLENFVKMLGYMGKGMLVIFVFIGVIILVTVLISKLFFKKN